MWKPCVVALVSFASACEVSSAKLDVTLRTDYQPIRDFAEIEVVVEDTDDRATHIVKIDAAYFKPGQRVAVFETLPHATGRRVKGILRDNDGDVVADAGVRFDHKEDYGLILALQRSCGELICEADERCWNEACVPDTCIDGTQSSCVKDRDGVTIPKCEDAGDCTRSAPCGTAVCDLGACFVDDQEHSCPDGQVCDLNTGCVPAPTPCTAASECTEVSECVGASCDANACVYSGVAPGTACSGGTCAIGAMGATCVVASCSDGVQNGAETGVDCGASCAPCGSGTACTKHAECGASEKCLGDVCRPVNLTDGTPCSFSNQCDSGACAGYPNRVCQTMAAGCDNGVRDSGELGVDCGGPCTESCATFDCAAQTDVPEAECEALVDFYHATHGSGWSQTSGWMTGDSVCNWQSVACSSEHIRGVSVSDTGLGGALPWGFDRFSDLRTINIRRSCCDNAALSGPIPGDIGALSKLTFLNLTFLSLSGSIPRELSLLAQVSSLSLNNNALSGAIPAELFDLVGLTQLSLSDNQLSGGLASDIGNLIQLTDLSLSGNRLTGSVPKEMGQLTQLNRLWLANNAFVSLPPELSQLTNLDFLSLNANNFSGPFPVAIVSMPKLELLYLGDNQFSGTIPTEVTNLSSLTSAVMCPQTGSLSADTSTGSWLRGIGFNNWPASDSC